jgi:hypothetical protein
MIQKSVICRKKVSFKLYYGYFSYDIKQNRKNQIENIKSIHKKKIIFGFYHNKHFFLEKVFIFVFI